LVNDRQSGARSSVAARPNRPGRKLDAKYLRATRDLCKTLQRVTPKYHRPKPLNDKHLVKAMGHVAGHAACEVAAYRVAACRMARAMQQTAV
jgi:hypothetical protein